MLLDPPPPVTPSRTPHPLEREYFMDGPLGVRGPQFGKRCRKGRKLGISVRVTSPSFARRRCL